MEKGVHYAEIEAAVPPEFREQIIELVRAGRTPEEHAEEYEPSAQTIRNWLTQADRDTGARKAGLTTSEKEEIRALRRENKVLRQDARGGTGRRDPAPEVAEALGGRHHLHPDRSGFLYLSVVVKRLELGRR